MTDRDLFEQPLAPAAPAAAPPTSRARARRADPHTSQDAAAAFYVSKLKRHQYEIYRLFTLFGPAYDEELCRRAKMHGVKQKESGIRTRRHELVELDLVRDFGCREILKDSRRESIVWEVNPKPQPRQPASLPPQPGGGTTPSSS